MEYVCRNSAAPDTTPNRDFIYDYLKMTHLQGNYFLTETSEVHTFILSFIYGNEAAEAKIRYLEGKNNGRINLLALQ